MSDELFEDVDLKRDPAIQARLDALLADTEGEKTDNKDFVVYWGKQGRYVVKLVIPEGRTVENYYSKYTTPFTKDGVTKDNLNFMVNVVFVSAEPANPKDAEYFKTLVDRTVIRHARVPASFLRELGIAVAKTNETALSEPGPLLDVEIKAGKNGIPNYRVNVFEDAKGDKKKFDARKADYPSVSIDDAVDDQVKLRR